MSLELIILVLGVIGSVAVMALVVRLVKSLRRGKQPVCREPDAIAELQRRSANPVLASSSEAEPEPERPRQIVVAAGEEQVLVMTVLDPHDTKALTKNALALDTAMFGRVIEPLMQVAPSMAVAAHAGSKQLMEVVINGPLVAAADGNGFRAITMGANGVQENARLFKPETLQNVANAAMIWQLASVVVAQKHLADISATLKRVEEKVAGVQSMLEEDRAAVIQSALNYIDTTRQAMQKGDFSELTRDKLEDIERELDRAGLTLVAQIRRECKRELEKDTVGCEGEYTSALAKHTGLAERLQELVTCVEVRIANWYLCTLYPVRSHVLESRKQKIVSFMADVRSLQKEVEATVDADCLKIDATFTSADTIAQRRTHVRAKAEPGASAVTSGAQRLKGVLKRVEAAVADLSTPSRLLVEMADGRPQAIYLSHERPDLPKLHLRGREAVAVS